MPVRQGGSYLKKSVDAKSELVERTAPAPHPNSPAAAPVEPVVALQETPVEESKTSSSKSTPKSKAKE